MERVATKKLIRLGRSVVYTIPICYLENCALMPGDMVDVFVEGETMTVRPAKVTA